MKNWIWVSLWLLFGGCAATPPDTRAETVLSHRTRADELIRRGDYQSASYYIEAELQDGGDEKTLLPLLVETQIRGDLLHAALHSLRRLYLLSPQNRDIPELFALLCELTGVSISLPAPEGAI